MGYVLLSVLLGFLGIRLFATSYNFFFPPKPTARALDQIPSVSILIPARNEADNLPTILDQLINLDPRPLEIIILNDQSTDNTEEILQTFGRRYPSIRYINGAPLPEGWLGKNWACHQLGQAAKGEYFLFLDADIASLHPQILAKLVAEAQYLKTALISIFPDQIMETWGERLTVPLMHYLLLSMLPLWWIYRLPFPSMAAANGQFMLFDGEIYRAQRWHEQAKEIIVEDIRIMQKVKEAGLKGMTFVGADLIRCRMYRSFNEGIQGFSKNILAGFGNSIVGLLLFLGLVVFGWIGLMIVDLPSWAWGGILTIMLLIRGMISYLAGQSIGINLGLHPAHMLLLVGIGILSIWKKFNGKNEWKGRNVQLPSPSSS